MQIPIRLLPLSTHPAAPPQSLPAPHPVSCTRALQHLLTIPNKICNKTSRIFQL